MAASIDALLEKDADALKYAREIASLRRRAAIELHGVCRQFVAGLNRLLARGEVLLDPAEFTDTSFQEDNPNLFQINVRGRILQVEFECTPDLVSTEEFRIPYTLFGSVRAFNQELLDKDIIEEQLIFYTLEKTGGLWRFFDARTYRTGAFDEDYLVTLMEQII